MTSSFPDPWSEPIDAWLAAHRQELVDIRRHLHMHPEPSGREHETTSYLAQRLDEVGVTATVLRDGLGLSLIHI